MPRLVLTGLTTLLILGGCEEVFEAMGDGTGTGEAGDAAAPEAREVTPVVDKIQSIDEHATAVGLRPRGDGTFVRETESGRAVATVAADGSVAFVKKAPDSPRPGVAVPGVGEMGRTPKALDRTRFMEETGEFRARLAATHLREQMNERLAALPRELRAIWKDGSRPATERRRILFERWDETFDPDAAEEAEPTDPSARALARVRAEGAAATRAEIERFIRETIPVGAADAYPTDELAALNEKRAAGKRFAPYTETERPHETVP